MKNQQNIITSENDQEDDDEKKMEIFFSLIRSFKQARDRRRQELQSEMEKSNKTRKLNHFQTPSPFFDHRNFTIIQPSQDQLQLSLSDHHKLRNQELDDEEDLNLKLSL